MMRLRTCGATPANEDVIRVTAQAPVGRRAQRTFERAVNNFRGDAHTVRRRQKRGDFVDMRWIIDEGRRAPHESLERVGAIDSPGRAHGQNLFRRACDDVTTKVKNAANAQLNGD